MPPRRPEPLGLERHERVSITFFLLMLAHSVAGVTHTACQFSFSATRSCCTIISLSEVRFFDANGEVVWSDSTGTSLTSTNPGGSPSPPASYATNNYLSDYWKEGARLPSVLQMDFLPAVEIAAYELLTTAQTADYDPTAWPLECTSDGSTWNTVDTQAAVSPPLLRSQHFNSMSAPYFVLSSAPTPYPPRAANGTNSDVR